MGLYNRRRRRRVRPHISFASRPSNYPDASTKLSKRHTCHELHFSSLKAFMEAEPNEYTREHRKSDEWVNPDTINSDSWKDRWYGVPSGGHKTVMEYAKNGWKDGVKQIKESLKTTPFVGVTSTRRRKVKKDFGDYVDMQAVYAGSLDRAWGTTERSPQRGLGRNVATLLVNISANGGRSQSECFWRGALLVTLADALTASGRSVRIVGYDIEDNAYNDKPNHISFRTFVIKEATAPLLLERVTFATACVGFLRFYGFRAQCSPKCAEPASGLGSAVHLPAGEVQAEDLPKGMQKQMGDAGTWVVDNIWSKEHAQDFLTQMTDKLNGIKSVG